MSEVKSFTQVACILSVFFGCCTLDDTTREIKPQSSDVALSIEEAHTIYNDYLNDLSTRGEEESSILFKSADADMYWKYATASAESVLSAVDVDLYDRYKYIAIRKDEDGNTICINTLSKIVVMKSSESGETAIYLRTLIPDKYDENLANTYALSCESRGGFSGIEYFSTLNGMPVSVAKFDNGKVVDNVFMGDTNLSESERMEKLSAILKNIIICRCDNGTRVKDGEWEYGKPGETFVDKNGSSYIYVDTDGDGKADAITQNFDYMSNTIFQRGSGSSGGGSSSGGGYCSGSANNFGNGGTIAGTGRESSNSGNSGSSFGNIIGGGGGTGSGGNGCSDSSHFSGGEDIITKRWESSDLNKLGIDPLGFSSIDGDILKTPQKPQKPKYDYKNSKSDPLVNMKGICGTPGAGIKGGRFMANRDNNRKHNGVDIKADIGEPVYAMFRGKVTRADNRFDPNAKWSEYKTKYKTDYGAGNRIWLEGTLSNGDKFMIKYFHLNEAYTEFQNKTVELGTVIGTVGATGSACSSASGGPHLHVEIIINGTRQDPENYFYTKFDNKGNPIFKLTK